jgi:hypothetical protein
MVQAGITVNSADLEQICVLSANNFISLETQMVSYLMGGVGADEVIESINNNTIQPYLNSQQLNGELLFGKELEMNDKKNFDLKTSAGLTSSTTSKAMIAVTVPSDQTQLPSFTGFVGTNVPKTVSVIEPTSAHYDSNLTLKYEPNEGPFYLDGYVDFTLTSVADRDPAPGDFSIRFDGTNENATLQLASNSQFATIGNTNSAFLQELTDFNTTIAMGQAVNNFIELSNTIEPGQSKMFGRPLVKDIAEEYTLNYNGYSIVKEDFGSFDSLRAGSYALQTTPNIFIVNLDFGMNGEDEIHNLIYPSQQAVSLVLDNYGANVARIQTALGLTVDINRPTGLTVVNEDYSDPAGNIYSASNTGILTIGPSAEILSLSPGGLVGLFPLFNSSTNPGGLRTVENRLPTSFSLEDYINIFDRETEITNNGAVPLADYILSIRVDSNQNSGYSLDSLALVEEELIEHIFLIDNSNLADNAKYIRDLVNLNHKLTFNNATINFQPKIGANSLHQGDILNINDNLLSIIDGKEALPQSLIGINGNVILDTRDFKTRAIDVINFLPPPSGFIPAESPLPQPTATTDLAVSIYYNINEDQRSRTAIPEVLKTNSYVKYNTQLVYKAPRYSNLKLASSNGATLNLYSPEYGLINDEVRATDIEFLANPLYTPNEITIFKVETSLNLSNTSSLLRNLNPSGSQTEIITNIDALVTLNNFNNISQSLQGIELITKAKIICTPKPIADLSLYKDAVSINWNIIGQGDNTKLVASSTSGFAADSKTVLSYADVTGLISGTTQTIPYIITNSIGTSGSTSTNSSTNMSDILTFNWTAYGGISKSLDFHNDSINMSRINYSQISSTSTNVDVSRYTLPSSLLTKNIQLSQIISVKTYQLCINDILLRSYSGIKLTTPTITSTSTQYNLIDVQANRTLPSSILAQVTSLDGIDFAAINTSVTSVSLSGAFIPDDFKCMNIQVIGIDNTEEASLVELTTISPISIFYGIEHTIELHSEYENVTSKIGDLSITLHYDAIDEDGVEKPLILDNENDYQIILGGEYTSNYNVSMFSSSGSNLLNNNNVDFNDRKYLTPIDGYANVKIWDTNTYYVDTEIADSQYDGVTILNITNGISSPFEITLKNETLILWPSYATMLVAFGSNDVWSAIRVMGDTENTAVSHRRFFATDYSPVVGSFGYLTIDDGIYADINYGLSEFNISSLQNDGQCLDFFVSSDKLAVNMIGQAFLADLQYIEYDSTASQIVAGTEGLNYQYTNGNYFSRVLQLQYYRGYYGEGMQNYEIERETLKALFSITDEEGVVRSEQEFVVFAEKNDYVNNLSNDYGTIGLGLNFNYSMLAINDQTNYDLFIQGDDVIITIANPGATENVQIIDLTLKDYNIYTFTGTNFANTGFPLTISSSRVKLNTITNSNDYFIWGINLHSGYTSIYYDSRYLGNPENKFGNPESNQIPVYNWDYPDWVTNPTLSNLEMKNIGFDVNGYKITSTVTLLAPNVSYFVQTPPYMECTQRILEVSESLPIDTELNPENIASVFIPMLGYNNKKEYKPFQTTNYNYIDEQATVGVIQIIFDSTIANNFTLTDSSYKNASEYATNPNSMKRNFNVEGAFITIDSFLGLKSQHNQFLVDNLFNRTASSRLLFAGGQTDNVKLIWKEHQLSESLYALNDGVVVKIRQRLNNIYSGNEALIIGTNDTILEGNITLDIGSFFLNESSSLDLQAGDGLRVYLYSTKLTLPNSGIIGKITIEKYKATNVIDFNSNIPDVHNLISMLFTTREVINAELPPAMLRLIEGKRVLNDSDYLGLINLEDVLGGVAGIPWTEDLTFTNTEFAQIVSYTEDSMTSTLPKLFLTEADETAKGVLITQNDILNVTGKDGLCKLRIRHDGTLITPTISTTSIVLNSTRSNTQYTTQGPEYTNLRYLSSVDGYNLN